MYTPGTCPDASTVVGLVAIATRIHTEGVIEGSGRVVQFLGVTLAADFDVTPETLAPHIEAIIEKLGPIEDRVIAGEFDKLEVGIYGGEVRVWGVHGPA